MAVQAPDAEIQFVDKTFKRIRGRVASRVREDFCGTALSACEWVKTRTTNTAVGVDLSGPTLAWGKKHNVAALQTEAQGRITLLKQDVRNPTAECMGVDAVLAMNFSYWIFKTRAGMLEYFKSVRESLAPDGILFMDHYGGYEATREQQERRPQKGFTYVWDQAKYNPITGDKVCHIHFEFKDGTKMHKAFSYEWRLWTLPEVRELLTEAGFKNVTVYWEGDDGKGGGNGVFKATLKGDADASFICYLTAEK